MKVKSSRTVAGLAFAALAIVAAVNPASAASVSAVLTLVPATPTANTFDITVDVLGELDTQSVVYTGVLRPVMEIDFANMAAPVVHTLDLAGLDADVAHTNATFSVSLGTAVFTGITGRIKTVTGNSPAPVTGGAFSSSDHQLIAWHGTIDVTPIIGSPTSIDLFQHTFRGNFTGTNNSTVAVTLDSIAGGMATYNIEINAVLDSIQISTGEPQIDNLIKIFIDGNVVARGQFVQAIPEPTAWALASVGLMGLARRGRR